MLRKLRKFTPESGPPYDEANGKETGEGVIHWIPRSISTRKNWLMDVPVSRATIERLDEWLMALASPLLPLREVPAGPDPGGFRWAFPEHTERALLVGKAVRIVSGIRSALFLADRGYITECGTILRTVSDFATEVVAVCEGSLNRAPTTAQKRFLQQYFAPAAENPDDYDKQQREKWVTRDDLIAASSRWATEFQGDPSQVRKIIRFLAYAYDKFVHGSYLTAMELYDRRTNRFMLSGHESEEVRRGYKGMVASILHESVVALAMIATVANMPALVDEIHKVQQELFNSGELSSV